MTTSRYAKISSTLRVSLAAGAGGSVLLLSGCGGESESQAAVKKAGRSFTAVALGDPNASPTKSDEIYRAAEQDLSRFAGDSDAFAEAAAVGVAMAKRGQAALASHEVSQAENNAFHKARVIRGMINEYLTMSAIAQAASTFDPGADIADIESIILLRRDDIGNYEREMQSINREIEAHEAKIADLRSRAGEQRNEAGALELQIPRVSATEGAELAAQAREFTLRADQFDFEATRIEGIVAQLRPGAREVSLNVEKARAQIALLGDAIDELRERARQSQNDAAEARTNANEALSRITDAVADYQSHRDGQVESTNDRAISLIRAAISASREARDAVKTVATINKSDAQQTLAEFQMRRANGEREEAMLYLALIEAGVPGDWQASMDSASTSADELEAEAKQSYQDAASSLRAIRANGDAGEKLDATAQRLDQLGGVEPEIEYDDEGSYNDGYESDDTDADLDEDAENAMSGLDPSAMTLDELLENTPEEMRDTVRAQMQALFDQLNATESVDELYTMLDGIDSSEEMMAEMLPPEMATEEMLEQMSFGFDWVRAQIMARVDELESEG